ncbi:hypothetical protein ABZ922_44750 [Streptomyces shenzhenensis]|uniref:hypothetical protein n=1 Tax=Streptomyces shenzhenensis TaxID=943815 RepID=UPI0033C48D42
MTVRLKPSTVDDRLAEAFGAPVPELYATVVTGDASPAVTRALELRSFLALAEEQVARVRDRVHADMAPDRDMSELSAERLRFDAQWLDAALYARDGYRAALEDLLRTMPPRQQPRPVRIVQASISTTLPPAPAAPALSRAGAARPRRP